MSYRTTTSGNTPRHEHQQERLRIARQVLAQVEAKYVRKRQRKQHLKRKDERQGRLAQRYVE